MKTQAAMGQIDLYSEVALANKKLGLSSIELCLIIRPGPSHDNSDFFEFLIILKKADPLSDKFRKFLNL